MDAAKIIRLVALLVAVVAAFVIIPAVALILVILGLAMGFVGVPADRRLLFMVATVTLATVSGTLQPVPFIGDELTSILGNLSAIFNAGALAVLALIMKDRLTE
jgi:hypothetical protein